MAHPFRIDSSFVMSLDQIQLTKLLQILLHCELKANGIFQRGADVALNITVADGGEDGRVEWNDGPEQTDYIPSKLTLFQNKAVNQFGPTACADELVASNGDLKPRVREVFEQGGTYVLFTTVEKNGQQISACIQAMREKLIELGKPYANEAKIEIYEASKISGWVDMYLPAIVAVSNWVGRPLERGLKTYWDWANTHEFQQFAFVPDQDRQQAVRDLREHLASRRSCARVMGLSGLGKTRLAFEVFKETELENEVVYADASMNGDWIYRLVVDWIQSGIEGVLVVDNCEARLHNRLKNEVRRRDSKLALLSLDYNFDDVEETVVVRLNRLPDALIKEMLEPIYAAQIQDLDRVVSFSQGFPQMAVLLANARLNQSQQMGRLNDAEIANKLLWGGEDANRTEERILIGCSLFDQFGLDEDAGVEYEFIANRVVAVDPAEFYSCIKKFEQRGIIYRRGRYAQLVPKPLAIRLAADWWKTARPQDQQGLINSDMPESLLDGFCSQVARLDFLPEVKALTEAVCGEQGPFGQAEAILSDRGSLLFRSFAVVNPDVTSRTLLRVLGGLDRESVLSIQGGVRRNLVVTLERLCFYSDHFFSSAYALFILAEAENESWGNNAAGIFKQLFSTFLSGTEASPDLRLSLLDRVSEDFGNSGRSVVIGALQSALQAGREMRTVGAEYQGSREPLIEWRPKVWSEAFTYWDSCLNRLVEIVIEGGEFEYEASQAISHSLRGLIQYGRIEGVEDAIQRIVAVRGPLWPEAVDAIKTCLEYDSKKMPAEAISKLQGFLRLLSPTDLGGKLKLLVSQPGFEHIEVEGEWIDVAGRNACVLAGEVATNVSLLTPYLRDLLEGEQRQAYIFGQEIAKQGGDWASLVRVCIELLPKIENRNISLILGLLSGVNNLSKEQWRMAVEELFGEASSLQFMPFFLTTGEPGIDQLDRLVDVFREREMDFSSFNVFGHGMALKHLSPGEVASFVRRLANAAPSGAWPALEVGWMYCHSDKNALATILPAIAEFLPGMSLAKRSVKRPLAFHHWMDSVKRLLVGGDEGFARAIFQRVLDDSLEGIDYSDSLHYVKPAMGILFRDFGSVVVPSLVDYLRRATALEQFQLINLFGSLGRMHQDDQSIMAGLPLDQVALWCKEYPDVFPSFLARTSDALLGGQDGMRLSPVAQYLIDEYGEDESVISGLSAKMGTFSWSGSVVPYFEGRLSAVRPLLEHKLPKVRAWAAQQSEYLNVMIRRERSRDEEQDFGRF